MRYRYRAVDQQGTIRRGVLPAAHLADLEQRLARLALTLIDAREEHTSTSTGRISRRELINFCFHLEQLTRAGVPLLEGLGDLRDSHEQPHVRALLAVLIEDIAGGKLLSQALCAHPAVFDPVFVNLVQAGELSGELPAVLKRLADSIKWQDEMIVQTRRILMYPAFVAVLVLAVLCFLLVYLVPQLLQFMQAMQQQIPPSTQLLLWLSGLLTHFGVPMLLLLALSVLVLRWRWRVDGQFRLLLDGWLLRLPAVGSIVNRILLARFANVLALLYGAGIPVLDAIAMTRGVINNRVLAEALRQVESRISDGQGLSASFAQTGLFPPLVLRMLRVGEGSGQLDEALLNVAYFYERDIRDAIARAHALLEPVMTVLLGLALAWIMSAVLGPIFDAMSQLR
ncbi:type II secretion system F family protein [Chitinibacter sp. GC72]|uniref:type II secretion system F family protein n=1 Tax=Chitinibacter sp. GC72 TaxID=1526917 RepID=UPI0012FB1E10|nr:type II secretion system F family protein [Chitinibacter sp. GC72]